MDILRQCITKYDIFYTAIICTITPMTPIERPRITEKKQLQLKMF
jgi:hypothetical protein